MNKITFLLLVFFVTSFTNNVVYGYPRTGTNPCYDSSKSEYVHGYYRKDGTYVHGYYRHYAGTAESFARKCK